MGGVALLNYTVDAYGVFGRNTLGIYVLPAEDECKAAHIAKFGDTYDCFLLGDSRCQMTDVDGVNIEKIYNASIAGGCVEELYNCIKNNIPEGKILIYGIGLGQPGSHSDSNRLYKQRNWHDKAARYLFSSKAAEVSVRTIKKYLRGNKVRIKKNGSMQLSEWIKRHDVDDIPLHKLAVRNQVELYTNEYSFEQVNMEYYEQIAQLAKEKSLDIFTFIYPVHEEVMEGVVGTAGYKELSKWKDYILRLFPQTVDLSESEYNAKENFLCTDIIHYKSEVGVSFLNKEITPLMK